MLEGSEGFLLSFAHQGCEVGVALEFASCLQPVKVRNRNVAPQSRRLETHPSADEVEGTRANIQVPGCRPNPYVETTSSTDPTGNVYDEPAELNIPP